MPELKAITLAGTNITTTALGFGCNDLLGNKTQAQGLRLLEAAYDAGVRHFDVARKYNFGEAETLVGLFAQGRRDKITITTKFGMQPPGKLAQNKGVVQVLRTAIRASPLLRKMASRGAKAVTQRRQFDVASAQASLEKSLIELKTDYIDVFLLHECEFADCGAGLLQFLQDARTAGKIRAFGIGTSPANTRIIYEDAPEFTGVLQFKHTILDPSLDQLFEPRATRPRPAFILHGAVSELPMISKKLQTDQSFARAMRDCFGIDGIDTSLLAGLLLQQALYANPDGLVLFRSANPDRIAGNVRAATEISVDAAAFERFAGIVVQQTDRS